MDKFNEYEFIIITKIISIISQMILITNDKITIIELFIMINDKQTNKI